MRGASTVTNGLTSDESVCAAASEEQISRKTNVRRIVPPLRSSILIFKRCEVKIPTSGKTGQKWGTHRPLGV